MKNHSVAAIVYGRTYSEDFRLLFAPEDFSNRDRKIAQQYINASLQSPELLHDRAYRWSAFKLDRHIIFGVSCFAYDISRALAPEPSNTFKLGKPQSFAMTHDAAGRSVQVFVGLAKHSHGDPVIPIRDPALYGELYDNYVSHRWWDSSSNWRRVESTQYSPKTNYLSQGSAASQKVGEWQRKVSALLYEIPKDSQLGTVVIPRQASDPVIWNMFFSTGICQSLCINFPRELVDSKLFGHTKFECVVTSELDEQGVPYYVERYSQQPTVQEVEFNKEKYSDPASQYGKTSGDYQNTRWEGRTDNASREDSQEYSRNQRSKKAKGSKSPSGALKLVKKVLGDLLEFVDDLSTESEATNGDGSDRSSNIDTERKSAISQEKRRNTDSDVRKMFEDLHNNSFLEDKKEK